MNTILARFRIVAGKEADAEEAMKKMASSVESAEPGAQTYIFHRSRKDPAQVTVFEVYQDDDASQAHRDSEYMATFQTYFGPLFDPESVKVERLERIVGFAR